MMSDMLLFITSFIYFWTVMFDRHPRHCAVLAGLILVGTAGVVMKPEEEQFFRTFAACALAALLVSRAYLIWREQ